MNKTSQYEFTILIPVFDEEENLLRVEKEMAEYLRIALMKSCVVFINDGSRDNSLKLIQEICNRQPDMFYLSFDKNRQKSAVLKAGFDYTFSNYVGYIDADLQTIPQDFNLLLKYAPDYAMVNGTRVSRQDSLGKKISSKIGNGFRRMMINDGIQDTGCPLKVMKTEYAKRMPLFTGMHRFLPALIQYQDGGEVKQIPINHFPRTAGVSKYNLWNRLLGPLNDCFSVRWIKNRYINYTIGQTDL